ncbi:hypothetical protein AAFF_G00175580 [Aldrovandia affinis]|uniref:Uncharacterized protein n=1 Tax=Aldrovandia affinis TaxID=143900 RepID=A0AAD7RLE0_9TELE|nr:hypothetical protein AAFF_G00175580 [Aldrovandia affinis]
MGPCAPPGQAITTGCSGAQLGDAEARVTPPPHCEEIISALPCYIQRNPPVGSTGATSRVDHSSDVRLPQGHVSPTPQQA